MKLSFLPLSVLMVAALVVVGIGCTQSTDTTDDSTVTNTATDTNGTTNDDDIVTTDTTTELDKTFDLKVDQTALVNEANVELQLAAVTNDSRCPTDAQCITAGNVTVELNVAVNGTTEKVAVTGSGNQELPAIVEVLGYRVTMLGVTPQPKTGETIAPTDYIVTFTVSSTGTATTNPAE